MPNCTAPFIQLTGLSGSGKSTIANGAKNLLRKKGLRTEVIDADIFRKILCRDLGYSQKDRNENIRRLGAVANLLATNGVISILAAINPYEEIRQELSAYGSHVQTVWINCDIATLIKRDTKQLYKRALLPDGDKDKIKNLSGINDPYEFPPHAHLVINTSNESEEACIEVLFDYIIKNIHG